MKTGGNAYAKSGVGGGILIVIPGVCGIGIVSPRLDKHGNSKRGISAGIKIARKLNKNMFSKTKKVKKKRKNKTRRKNKFI